MHMSPSKIGEQESQQMKEEWVQSNFIDLPILEKGKLVEWFFLNTRMLLLYDTFEVQEIELASKEVLRSYNL